VSDVFVKVLDGDMSSVKVYITQYCAVAAADDDVNGDDVFSNAELLVNVDKLPPNQRVLLQNLYEEVSDVLKDKQSDVDSMLQCLENATVAYEVTLLHFDTDRVSCL